MTSLVSRVLFTGVLLTSMTSVASSQKVDPVTYPARVNEKPVKAMQGDDCIFLRSFWYGKTMYQVSISYEGLSRSRKWNLETSKEWIPLGKVAEIARDHIKSLRLEDEPKGLASISVINFCSNDWIYIIEFINDGPEKIVKVAPDELRVLGNKMYLFMRPDGVFIMPEEKSRLNVVD